MKILTIGTWDLWHEGHTTLLARCATLGDYMTRQIHLGVNSDTFVRQYKQITCAQNQAERIEAAVDACLSLGVKAHVHLNDGPGVDLIRQVKPDILVVGSDWHGNGYEGQIGMSHEEMFEELGLSILYVPRTPGISSGALREQIRQRSEH